MRASLPPGPSYPSLIQGIGFWSRPLAYLEKLRSQYGKRFTLRFPFSPPFVFITEPDQIKQVFTAPPDVLHPGEGARVLAPIVGSNSVILLDGDAHMSQRKLMLPAFHGEKMERLTGLIAEVTEREVEDWGAEPELELHPRMQALTLEIILRAVFGLDEGERLVRLRTELRRLLDLVTNPRMMVFPALLGPQRLARIKFFQRDIARVDEPIYEEIRERRRATDLAERDDILSLLLQARHEDGTPMSDVALRDELMTLLVAGHETTSTALAWAVERLIRHPEKLERLRAEVLAGEDAYLTATIQETLRLRPVIVLVARRLTEPVEIGGWQLPAGITITPSIYLVHRHPDIYPDPERFLPERFLDNPPGTYTWIPFGGGVRRCLGGAFAQFEMRVVLAELVRRRRLEPAHPESEPVKRRAITETPRHNTEVIIR